MLTGLRRQGLDQIKIYPECRTKPMENKGLSSRTECRVSQASKGLFAIRQEPPRELKKVTEKPRLLSLGRNSPRPEGAFRRSPGFSVLLLSQILLPSETVGLPGSSPPRSSFLPFMVLAQDINTS